MLRLAFMGDISILYGEEVEYGTELKGILDECDYRICNFEGALSQEKNTPISKFGPSIIQASNSVSVLEGLGINVVCLANNHIYDYGYDAAKKTIEELEKSSIKHIGLSIDNTDSMYTPQILKKDGVKVAIFNAAENGFGCATERNNKGYAWLFSQILRERVLEYRDKCDYEIVVAHGGLENEPIPLPEWREAYKHFIDLGVDAVVATHSHVVQSNEVYRGKPIYYSLGNFIYQENGYDPRSQILILEFTNNQMHQSSVLTRYNREIGIVDLYDNTEFAESIDKYKAMLLNEKDYLEYINRKCLELYHDYYEKYYAWGECVYDYPIRMRILSALSLLIKGHKSNNDVKYHNIAIETNLWVARRAIDLLWRDNEQYNPNI